ncbi:hypothetical protein NIES267_52810 [Calothrix parasitica NIES-267]|uniref:Uncharacterized protein n=1 Tax=Calothrix parasitica NIES-267 TaxID=1973488 RepID=A0A1Z4LX60_9CYAN|nr:hypothetical protein NIES267_52810 [Calothrix parasitica NIES-267]
MFDCFDELKTSFEKEVKLGKTKFILNAIGQPFEVPESARPLQLIQDFHPLNTRVVLDEGITIEENCWKVESYSTKENKLLVFEYPEFNPAECLLVFQVKVKVINSDETISLFLNGCDFHGLPFKLTRADKPLTITTAWNLYEFPFHYRKNQFSQSFIFGLKIQSKGLFWSKISSFLKVLQQELSNLVIYLKRKQ